jgi:hypothetical protein
LGGKIKKRAIAVAKIYNIWQHRNNIERGNSAFPIKDGFLKYWDAHQ